MKINDIPLQGSEHITLLLQRLAEGAEEFVVLERDERHFLQSDGSSLEYKNPAGLYRCTRQEFTLKELQELFIDYSTGGNRYLAEYQWAELPGFCDWEPEPREELPPPKGLLGRFRRLFGL